MRPPVSGPAFYTLISRPCALPDNYLPPPKARYILANESIAPVHMHRRISYKFPTRLLRSARGESFAWINFRPREKFFDIPTARRNVERVAHVVARFENV